MKATLPSYRCLRLPPWAPLTPLQTVLRWKLTLLWNFANYTSQFWNIHLDYFTEMDINGLLALKKRFSLILENWILCFGKEKWTGEREVWAFSLHPSNYGKVSFLLHHFLPCLLIFPLIMLWFINTGCSLKSPVRILKYTNHQAQFRTINENSMGMDLGHWSCFPQMFLL